MSLYREVDHNDGHWHDIGKICRCGGDFTEAEMRLVVPTGPDLALNIGTLATVAWAIGNNGHSIDKAHQATRNLLDELGIGEDSTP